MLVREIMQKGADVIHPDASIVEAAILMRDGDFGALPVLEDNNIIGMITDRDIAIRAVSRGDDVNACRVRDVMTDAILTCSEDADIHEVATLMGQRQVRRIPVLNANQRLVGIVSLGDIARHESHEEKTAEALSKISRKTHREPKSNFGFMRKVRGPAIGGQWPMFTAGLLTGSLITWLLDPNEGGRRRALVRDKGIHFGNSTAKYGGKLYRHLRNRTKGISSRMNSTQIEELQ